MFHSNHLHIALDTKIFNFTKTKKQPIVVVYTTQHCNNYKITATVSLKQPTQIIYHKTLYPLQPLNILFFIKD